MLFREYETALGISLCFQGFEHELASLPGDYARPSGRLLLARWEGELAGCAALHAFDASERIGEMKRLFVRDRHRGRGIGRALATRIIDDARAIGYRQLRLDTLAARMPAAVALYRSLGFVEIPSYRHNPEADALYLALDLRARE